MRWPEFFWHRKSFTMIRTHIQPTVNIADIRKKHHETVKKGKRREARSAAK